MHLTPTYPSKKPNFEAFFGTFGMQLPNRAESGGLTAPAPEQLTVYPKSQDPNGSALMDDYYTFSNILFHESKHRAGYFSGIVEDSYEFNHFKILRSQVEHSSFSKMSKGGVGWLSRVGTTYLQGQSDYLMVILEKAGSSEAGLNSKEFKQFFTEYSNNINFFKKIFGRDSGFDADPEKWKERAKFVSNE